MRRAATLPLLKELPPGDQARIWARLQCAPTEALADGWDPWELPEAVAAIARGYGVRPTHNQRDELLTKARSR